MVQSVTLRNMPSFDGSVPPMVLYNDKWLDICVNYWEESHPRIDEIEVNHFYDGDIPTKFGNHLSKVPYSGESDKKVDEDTVGLKDTFQDFSPSEKELFSDIEDEWGAGPGADEWTYAEALEQTSATDSMSTTRNNVSTFIDDGMAKKTGRDGKKTKVRLTESRYTNPDAATDGGGYEWNYDWEGAIEKMEERDLWDTGPQGKADKTKYDPRDWFASQNEGDIIDLFRHLNSLNTYIKELYHVRYEYEAKVDENGLDSFFFDDEDREEYVKDMRDIMEKMKGSVNDFFDLVKRLTLQALRNCASWWVSCQGDLDVPKEYNPTNKRKTCRNRIDSKRWAFNKTHISPVIHGNVQKQIREQTYTEQVYQTEKSVRALLHAGWSMHEDIIRGTSEPTDDSETIEEQEEDDDEELSGKLKNVELTLEDNYSPTPANMKEGHGCSWDTFVTEFRDWIGDDEYGEDRIATALENYHQWCLDHDHTYSGVVVWDAADNSDPIDMQIFAVVTDMNPGYFEKRSYDWREDPDVLLPPPES